MDTLDKSVAHESHVETKKAVGDEARAEGVEGRVGVGGGEAVAGLRQQKDFVGDHGGEELCRVGQAPQTLLSEADVCEGQVEEALERMVMVSDGGSRMP